MVKTATLRYLIFWRANECQLWVLDDMVDRFDDQRETLGFNFQIEAVNRDLHDGRFESATVPLAAKPPVSETHGPDPLEILDCLLQNSELCLPGGYSTLNGMFA